MKILIVENNKADYELIKNMIEEKDNDKADIRWVQQLNSGFKAIEKENFDVALLDLTLPDSKGIETYDRFKDSNPGMPVIVLSDTEDELCAVMSVRKGAHDYITKNNVSSGSLHRSLRYAIERKQCDRAIRDSEEKFRAIFRESLDVILIVDCYSGLIYNVNPAIKPSLGYSSRNLIGKHYSTLFPNESFLNRSGLLSKVVINGSAFESQEFLKSDGTKVPMDLSATIIPWGKTKAILVSLRDAADRKMVEKEMMALNNDLEKRVAEKSARFQETIDKLEKELILRKKAEAKIEEAKFHITKEWEKEKSFNELTRKFIAAFSKECKSPLEAITNSSQFLEFYDRSKDEEKFKRHVLSITSAVETISMLLEDIKFLENFDPSIYKPKMQEFNILNAVEKAIINQAYDDDYRIEFDNSLEDNFYCTDIAIFDVVLKNIMTCVHKYFNPESILKVEFYNETIGLNIKFTEAFEDNKYPSNGSNLTINPENSICGYGMCLYAAKEAASLIGGCVESENNITKSSSITLILPELALN